MLLDAPLSPEVAWYGQLHSTSATPPVSLVPSLNGIALSWWLVEHSLPLEL